MTELSPLYKIEKDLSIQPQVSIPVRHAINGGIYEREIDIPKGTALTGKIHLTDHLSKLVKGTLIISTEDASGNVTGPFVYTGPMTFKGKKGEKRFGIAVDDCIFSCTHWVGEMTDIEQIENMLVVDTMQQFLTNEMVKNKCLS